MNAPKIIIREMRDDDISAVSDIVCACYNWLARVEGYTPEETSRLISERGSPEAVSTQRKKCHFIVATIDDGVVGAVAIHKNTITKLYISPDRFRQGIGSALFDSAEKYIAGTGYNDIFLGAFPSSARFYEAKGMELEGEKIATGGPIKGRTILLYRKEVSKIS